ncbi:hypothetical protein B3286c1_0019 [Brucella vulpis]|uniref:hypothetical protein n=1 Tax=Brucella vulpis TaxID=981386 RepID=UPI00073AA329|nr:hypothetical protein BF3285c1_0021 [Brucella vulpis]CUW48858.1 hypothetical protein B3286c1_0019 [Brucella vulpis]
MKNPSIFGSSQKRGVLIPICSRFESVTFRESEAILTLPEVCQQSEPACFQAGFFYFKLHYSCILRDAGLQRAIYLRFGAHVASEHFQQKCETVLRWTMRQNNELERFQ